MGTESLRETIEKNLDAVENSAIQGEGLQADASADIPGATPPAPDAGAGDAPTKGDDRARDDKGRFIEAKDGKTPPAKAPAAAAASATPGPQPGATPPAVPQAPAIARPSTWKKDHWESFDKIAKENPALAQYLVQREQEFTRGVATYKQEWDRAKPLLDAMEPFMPDLRQHGIEAHQWISNLGNAHKLLALGTPEQKLSMFAQLARDYSVPLEHLFVRGQDGNIYRNSQFERPMQMPAPQQTQQRAPDVKSMVQEALATERANAEAEEFLGQLDKYPHFDAVKDDMVRLLEAGFAESYPDAYAAALRLPKHEALYQQDADAKRQADEARQAEERKAAAEAARRKAVSPRSSTPTGAVTEGKAKNIRAALENAFDEHAGGRV